MNCSLHEHLLRYWRQRIRTEILSKRRAAAGREDAPLEAFVGDKNQLAREVEQGLEAMTHRLIQRLQREAAEEDLFSPNEIPY